MPAQSSISNRYLNSLNAEISRIQARIDARKIKRQTLDKEDDADHDILADLKKQLPAQKA